MSLSQPGRVSSVGVTHGVAAPNPVETELPWEDPTIADGAFLQAASNDSLLTGNPPSKAQIVAAGWDRAKLEKELFINAFGKWFAVAEAISVGWESPASVSVAWSASSAQVKLGQSTTFNAIVSVSYGQARASTSGGQTLNLGSGNDLSTSNEAIIVGGSSTDWWQKDRRRYTAATISSGPTVGSGLGLAVTGTTTIGGSGNQLAAHSMTASTTLGTIITDTPDVTGTYTFTPNTVDYVNNLGESALSAEANSLDIPFGTTGSVIVTNYVPWWKSTDNGVNWSEQDASASGRITSVVGRTGKAVNLTIPAAERHLTKFWIPSVADGWNSAPTMSNGVIQNAAGKLSIAVDGQNTGNFTVYGTTANPVTHTTNDAAPVAPYNGYSGLVGVTIGPFSSSSEDLIINVGWGNYTPS